MDSGLPAPAILLFCDGSSGPYRTEKLGQAVPSLMFWSAHQERLPRASHTRSEHAESAPRWCLARCMLLTAACGESMTV